ncbi:MAG: MBL fold metallo-hydrolase [Pyrinomonadaceae bacterium]
MKKWLIRLIGVFALFVGILIIIILVSEFDQAVIKKYVKNNNLQTFKINSKGTPVDQKSRFVNLEFPYLPSTVELLKWQLSTNPQKDEKQTDSARLAVNDPTDFLSGTQDGILWLGHAGFLIRINGISILSDPIFGNPPFVKTFVDVPSPLEKLQKVDYVLVSHDHRDHCDEETLRQIAQKFPGAKFLGGLGMEELFNDWKTPSNEVQTAGWHQKFSLKDETVKIFFLPIRHWSRRGLFDTNKRLWGGFLIQSAQTTIYFGGDSGYGVHYRELAEFFPKIDYFIVGIGAYEPRWFMKPNHNSPADTLQGFIDSKAKFLVPMHFGRFDLSDEPASEPLRLLNEKANELSLTDKIKALNIYENINLNN